MRSIRRLEKFPRADDVRAALHANVDAPPDGAVAQRRKGSDAWGVLLYGPDYTYGDASEARRALLAGGEGQVLHWRRARTPDLTHRATRAGSRTDAALALLAGHPDLRPIDAARRLGIDPTAVYQALRRTERAQHCPHCGERLVGYARA